MIKDLPRAATAIANWIEAKATEAGAKTLVFGLSGGIDSALVALLCKMTGLPCVGVLMPCQSSESSIKRANQLAKKHDIKTFEVYLDDAFDVISDQVLHGLGLKPMDVGNAANGALRSCLRSPTLDYVGKITNGIIVGTGNRDEDEMTRYFQKRGDGCVDISPIAKLHKSEVRQLSEFLGCTKAILDAKPSADLWGPEAGQVDENELGMTYDEIEKGIKEFGPLLNTIPFRTDPVPLPGGNYDERQKFVLEKLQRMEYVSRHKASPPPVFQLRDFPDLVD